MSSQASGAFSFRHLFKGSALYGSSDVIVALIRFSLIALYTRIMPPEQFGLFSIITVTLTLATVFVPLGLPSAVMLRLKPDSSSESRACKNEAVFLLLAISICCGVIFYFVSALFFPKTLVCKLAPWLIAWVVGEIVSMIPKVSLRYKEKIAAFSAAKITRVAIMVLLLFSLLRVGIGGISAVIISESIAAIVECILCMALDRYIPSKPSFLYLTAMLGIGLPLMFVSFGVFCIDLSDRYVVYLLIGPQANGFYSVAAKIAVAASYFTEAFNSMWFPYYLRMNQEAKATTAEDLKRFASRILVLFSLAISLFMMTLPFIMNVRILGKPFIAQQYLCASVLVAPFTLAYFFKAGFYLSSAVMIAAGKNWRLARYVYVAAIVNISANILLATLWGDGGFSALTAIALMTSVAYGLCMIMVSKSAGLFSVGHQWQKTDRALDNLDAQPEQNNVVKNNRAAILQIISKKTVLSAFILIVPFTPVQLGFRLAVWAIIASIIGFFFVKSKQTKQI